MRVSSIVCVFAAFLLSACSGYAPPANLSGLTADQLVAQRLQCGQPLRRLGIALVGDIVGMTGKVIDHVHRAAHAPRQQEGTDREILVMTNRHRLRTARQQKRHYKASRRRACFIARRPRTCTGAP